MTVAFPRACLLSFQSLIATHDHTMKSNPLRHLLVAVLPVSAFFQAGAANFIWDGLDGSSLPSSDWTLGANWGGTAPAYGSTQTGRLNVYNGAGGAAIYNPGAGVTTIFTGADAGSGRGMVIGNVGFDGALFVTSGTLVIRGVAGGGNEVLMANQQNAALTINGGVLDITGNPNAFIALNGGVAGITSTITVTSGSFLGKGVNLAATSNAAALTINLDGGIFATTGFSRPGVTGTSLINLNGGVLQAREADNAAFLNTLAGNTVAVKNGGAVVDTNGFNITIAAALTNGGTGGLVKNGSGALTLSGVNTYAGATAINTGALIVSNASGLGSTAGGTSVALNAALALSGGVNYSNAEAVTLTGPGLLTTGGVFGSVQRGSIQSVSGSNIFSGNITFTDSGNTRIGVQNGASLTLNGNITEAAANSTLIFRHSTTGVGNITLNGAGNSWTGNTDIYGGEGAVILGVDNALPATSHLRIGTSGTGTASTLDLNGKAQTLKGVSQIGTSTLGVITNNGAQDSMLTLASLAFDPTYYGVIKDGATNKTGLTLNSAGRTQTLAGVNTYTGTTLVSAGTLLINGSHHLAAGLITVSGGATLGGGGTVGNVSLSAGAHLAPGIAAGNFTLQDLTLDAGTFLDFELGAPDLENIPGVDLIKVTGSILALGGVLNVTELTPGVVSTAPIGSKWMLFSTASVPGSHSLTTGVLPARVDGNSYAIEALSGSGAVYLTVVPEAGTGLLAAMGLLVLWLRRRA